MPRELPPKKGRWVKGQSGNPGGMNRLPDDIRQAKVLNKNECDRLLNHFIYMTDADKAKAKASPIATQFEKIIISIIEHAIREGDPVRTTFILDRLIGKVRENIHVSLEDQLYLNRLKEIQAMTPEQQRELALRHGMNEIEVKSEVSEHTPEVCLAAKEKLEKEQ